jgi:flagellar hook protein FlgE
MGPNVPNPPTTPAANTIRFNFTGSTEYGSKFNVTNLTQNGYQEGQMSGITISKEGVVEARYSNGQKSTLGTIALTTFPNKNGLASLGNNFWGSTFESGDPLTDRPGVGKRGLLQASAVEESNVDLTSELVNMITAQRNYQANAQSIKTQDSVMQTLVNLR